MNENGNDILQQPVTNVQPETETEQNIDPETGEQLTPEQIAAKNEGKEWKHTPVDGRIEVDVLSDASQASLTLYPPQYEGKAITYSDVMAELNIKGITFGVDNDGIKRIIDGNLFNQPYLIAQALAPVDGIDGTITYLFDKQVETKPKEGENGFVDYRNLGFVRNVRAGTVIADITLPVDGVDGTNVKNTPIRHKIGVPVKVDKGENVGLTEDGTHLIVLADGNLKFSGRFSVETTFNLKGDVDASTGNLDFIGDIIIRGEVFEGFKVVSQKSVTIYENATGATIEANGNVVIKKGCINCKIISHGNVTVDFAESCVITCDGDLKGDAFVTSTVYCGGELTAQGRRGTLMGGQYTCLKNLLANSIGLKSYGETIVTVGDNAVMLNEKTECEKRLQNLETQILGCNQVALFLGEKKKAGVKLPPEREEMLATAEKQIIICNVEKEENEKRIADIMQYLETRQNLSITCKKELYPGTKITINDLVYQVNDKYQYCKIYLGEDGIKVETL